MLHDCFLVTTMLPVWVILIVGTSLFQCPHGSVTLRQIQPEPGDPICLQEDIVYSCRVVGNELIWTFEGENENTPRFVSSTPIGRKEELGSFTVILQNRTLNGNSGYVFMSEANSTHGLTPTDIGKKINCVGGLNTSSTHILITVSEPEIENASYCLNNISWSPPPCDANCTVRVGGRDIDTVPCGDGYMYLTTADDPDFNTENVSITAVDELGNVAMVQAIPAKDYAQQMSSTMMTNTTVVGNTAATTPISGTDIPVIKIAVPVAVITLAFFTEAFAVCFYYYCWKLKDKKNQQYRLKKNQQYQQIEEQFDDKPDLELVPDEVATATWYHGQISDREAEGRCVNRYGKPHSDGTYLVRRVHNDYYLYVCYKAVARKLKIIHHEHRWEVDDHTYTYCPISLNNLIKCHQKVPVKVTNTERVRLKTPVPSPKKETP